MAFIKAVFIATGRGRRAEGGGTVRRAKGGGTVRRAEGGGTVWRTEGGGTGGQTVAAQEGRRWRHSQEGRGWWHKLDVYSIRGVSVAPLGLQLLILFFSLPLPIVSLPSLPVSP